MCLQLQMEVLLRVITARAYHHLQIKVDGYTFNRVPHGMPNALRRMAMPCFESLCLSPCTGPDQVAAALEKIISHISNPKKFKKASPLLRQLLSQGSVQKAHASLLFEVSPYYLLEEIHVKGLAGPETGLKDELACGKDLQHDSSVKPSLPLLCAGAEGRHAGPQPGGGPHADKGVPEALHRGQQARRRAHHRAVLDCVVFVCRHCCTAVCTAHIAYTTLAFMRGDQGKEGLAQRCRCAL